MDDSFHRIEVSVSHELYERVDALARARAVGVGGVVLKAVREHVEANESLARDGLSQPPGGVTREMASGARPRRRNARRAA